jgi:hypothetical protein
MFDNVNNYYCDRPESGGASYASDGFPRERCTVLIMKRKLLSNPKIARASNVLLLLP